MKANIGISVRFTGTVWHKYNVPGVINMWSDKEAGCPSSVTMSADRAYALLKDEEVLKQDLDTLEEQIEEHLAGSEIGIDSINVVAVPE